MERVLIVPNNMGWTSWGQVTAAMLEDTFLGRLYVSHSDSGTYQIEPSRAALIVICRTLISVSTPYVVVKNKYSFEDMRHMGMWETPEQAFACTVPRRVWLDKQARR